MRNQTRKTLSKILFIHGYASSGANGAAILLRRMLYEEQLAEVLSPDVPTSPEQAMTFLRELVREQQPNVIVGTSMGALYAEQLRGTKRILVNPSFQMARHLTFHGCGRQEFRNKRADGAKDFKVDKAMIAEFKSVEAQSFKGITPSDRALVWGLFGDKDRLVDGKPLFRKHYGSQQMTLFDGEHYLNDHVVSRTLMPLLRQLL